MKKFLTLFVVVFLPAFSQADGLESMADFLRNTHSGRADFVQRVTPPAKEGRPQRVKTSQGSFLFERPGKFRFDYNSPFPQVLMADGRNFYSYDIDLAQVTVRPQAQALAGAPAVLFVAGADLAALSHDFVLQNLPDAEGLQWLQATPRQTETSLQMVRIGLQGQGNQARLMRLDIFDAFGQRSQMSFDHIEVNPVLPPAKFELKIPNGVQVIRP
jgi:outer membrane lipoprotein carrier protein